jgi:hypothetical protein
MANSTSNKQQGHTASVAGDCLVIFCRQQDKTALIEKNGRKLPNARCPNCQTFLVFDRAA